MRSCCKQVREFLEFGQHLHARVESLCTELRGDDRSEQTNLLLDYLSRHEHQMEEALVRVAQTSRPAVLDYWLNYSPTLDFDDVLRQSTIRPDMSADEVVDLAMQFDNLLIAIFRDVADKATETSVREIFSDLSTMERTERQQMLRAASSIRDM